MIPLYLSVIDDDNDREWLCQIYEKHKKWMLNTAYRLLKNKQDAEDAVQTVFVNISNCITSIPRNEEELKPYLYVCLRNAAYDILKKNKRFEKSMRLGSTAKAFDENFEEAVENKELIIQALEYIDTFPQESRYIMELHIAFEKNAAEISRALGIKYEKVKTTMKRCRKLLKEKFGDIL